MSPARFASLLLLPLALSAPCWAAVSELSRLQFRNGTDLGPTMLLVEPMRTAADAQDGPRAGETAAVYGERVRRAGLSLGLTPAQAIDAREFYLRRFAARFAAATVPRPAPTPPRPDLAASDRRITRALAAGTGWSVRRVEPAPTPSRRLLPSEAAARIDPAIVALMTRPRERPPVVRPVPQPRKAPAAGGLPTFWEWARGGPPGRAAHRDAFYGWAAAFNRRADGITAESTDDSVGGWLSRKSYRFAAGASSVVGFLNDDDAPGRMWNGLTGRLSGLSSVLTTSVREHPGASALLFLHVSVNPIDFTTRLAAADGDRRGKRLAASITRARETGRTWDILDAGYDTTTEVAELASYATGVVGVGRKFALRGALGAASDAAITSERVVPGLVDDIPVPPPLPPGSPLLIPPPPPSGLLPVARTGVYQEQATLTDALGGRVGGDDLSRRLAGRAEDLRYTPDEIARFDLGGQPYRPGEPILFGQADVSPTFSDTSPFTRMVMENGRAVPRGLSIDEVAAGLRSGRYSPNQLPVQALRVNGTWIAVNNRSLSALARAGMLPTRVVPVSAARLRALPLSDPDSLVNVLNRLAPMGGRGSPISLVRGEGLVTSGRGVGSGVTVQPWIRGAPIEQSVIAPH